MPQPVFEDQVRILGRAKYEWTPEARGSRNWSPTRQGATTEEEVEIQLFQVRRRRS